MPYDTLNFNYTHYFEMLCAYIRVRVESALDFNCQLGTWRRADRPNESV